MDEWRAVYDTDEMVKRYEDRLKIIGIRVEERDEAVLNMIPYSDKNNFRVLELGSGMGRFTKKIVEKFSNTQIVCVDGSATMLEAAKSRLKEYSKKITFFCKDFGVSSWVEEITGTFDVVVSTGAIHHISDQRKKELFTEVYNLLNTGGYFINGDLFKSKYDVVNKKYYDDVWARYIQQKTHEVLGIERDIEDVRNRMYTALKKEGDKPSTIEDQLLWLLEAGFPVSDCVWQYYLLAVIVGIK